VGALLCVAVATTLTYRYGGVATHLLASTLFEMSTMIIGLALDMGDIVTDCITCANVLQNPCLAEYHTSYAVLTSFAFVVGVLALGMRVRMIRELMGERRNSTSRASVVAIDGNTGGFQLSKAVANRKTRLRATRRDVWSACMGLSVFVLEDLTSECVLGLRCMRARAFCDESN